MVHPLKRTVYLQDRGIPSGMCSVCSANRHVIEAAMDRALYHNAFLLIEATANQVNQYGGYTGMRPVDFKNFVMDIARANDFPQDMLILGGDHMGPLVWKDDDAETAMAKACELVKELIYAGFTKIHIDTSMRLAGDDTGKRPDPALIAERGAAICKAAEDGFRAYRRGRPDACPPVYVIGSEVPVPGGSQEYEAGVCVTSAGDFEETLASYKDAFEKTGIGDCWDNVIAVVVQPGVEFGNDFVIEYNREAAKELVKTLRTHRGLVFEGHSTDYQKPCSLKQMVEDGIAILKVGPALTFALREALFGLDMIEEKLFPGSGPAVPPRFPSVLENAMVSQPAYWSNYYSGSREQVALDRLFGFSDRCRYYLPSPAVLEATQRLVSSLRKREIPTTLLSQYMPVQYGRVREGRLKNDPESLIKDKIGEVLENYYYAASPA